MPTTRHIGQQDKFRVAATTADSYLEGCPNSTSTCGPGSGASRPRLKISRGLGPRGTEVQGLGVVGDVVHSCSKRKKGPLSSRGSPFYGHLYGGVADSPPRPPVHSHRGGEYFVPLQIIRTITNVYRVTRGHVSYDSHSESSERSCGPCCLQGQKFGSDRSFHPLRTQARFWLMASRYDL